MSTFSDRRPRRPGLLRLHRWRETTPIDEARRVPDTTKPRVTKSGGRLSAIAGFSNGLPVGSPDHQLSLKVGGRRTVTDYAFYCQALHGSDGKAAGMSNPERRNRRLLRLASLAGEYSGSLHDHDQVNIVQATLNNLSCSADGKSVTALLFTLWPRASILTAIMHGAPTDQTTKCDPPPV